MGAWQSFVDLISSEKKAVQQFTQTGNPVQPTEQQINDKARVGIQENESFLRQGGEKIADVALTVAAWLGQKVISPYITRPMATAALLTDADSPLYKPGKYEKGFQLKDVVDAYNRSAKVSTMQALTKSEIIPGFSPLSKSILSNGDIDLDEVDVWDDASIKRNFSDNVIGKWYTGIGDFILGNKGVGVAGAGVVAGTRTLGKSAGVVTKGKTVAQFESEINSGIAFINGQPDGVQSVAANHMKTLADTEDINLISGIVRKYSTNDRLVPLIAQSKSIENVRDMVLADKGDLAAMQRLADSSPSDLLGMSGALDTIKSEFLITGQRWHPEGTAKRRIEDAFEDAIAKDPRMDDVRKAFLDDTYEPIHGGKNYFPAEPVMFKSAAIKAGEKIRDVKQDAYYRMKQNDFDNLELTNPWNNITSRFFRLTGTRMPTGWVTFSGMRPFEAQIELAATLDNLKMFINGADKVEISPNVFVTAAKLRKDWDLKFALAKPGVEKIKVLEEIDKQLGMSMAFKHGYYDVAEIEARIADFRATINKGLTDFHDTGYALDQAGNRITSNPQTARQLAESFRFTPWDEVERMFLSTEKNSKGKINTERAKYGIKSTYNNLSKVWTFDVLARPMFVIKQSLAEPILSVTLAQGLDATMKMIPTFTKRFLYNNKMRRGELLSKTMNKSEYRAATKDVEARAEMFSKAVTIKDRLEAEVAGMLKGTHSPAAIADNLKVAREELAAARVLLDRMELSIRDAMPVRAGFPDAIPSITVLERRLAWLKANPRHSAKLGDKIAEAELAIDNYHASINRISPDEYDIALKDDAVAKAYDDIKAALDELGEATARQAEVFGKSAEFKKRYYGEDTVEITVHGVPMTVDSFIASDSSFAAAIRAEVGNARTRETTYLGEAAIGTYKSSYERHVPGGPIRVGNPKYFEEKAYIANRFMRKDPLVDLILQEKGLDELMEWAATTPGRTYLNQFNISPKQYEGFIYKKISLVHREFPSEVARAEIFKREVTSQELATWLNKADELYDIHPSDHPYGIGAPVLGKGSFNEGINRGINYVFNQLMKPENPIREQYFNNLATTQVARRAEAAMAQGVTVTPRQLNAWRQAAGREALQEMEKVVYTSHRQHRLIHLARAGVAFPNATLNAFYRYGRLAAKNPVITTQFLNNYNRAFTNFGIDQYGNPTTDISKIAHIVIPGTKELGLNKGQGIALNAKSIGFLLNTPSPSYISTLAMGNIMKKYPTTEKTFQNWFGEYYEVMFPYGANSDIKRAFTPVWLNAALNYARGDISKDDYWRSYVSVTNYHNMLFDLGVEKKRPTDADLERETRALWAQKFFWGFVSPFGVPAKVETNPMGIFNTYFNSAVERHRAEGHNDQDAKTLAGEDMLATFGMDFMLDRVTYSGGTKNIHMNPTVEGYNRIWNENPELAGQLAHIVDGDPSLVDLMVADLGYNDEEFSQVIFNKLNEKGKTLPNSSQLVTALRKSPQEIEDARIKYRTWQDYHNLRVALEAKITDGRSLRAHKELSGVLEAIARGPLREQSQSWYDDWNIAENGDASYGRARGLHLLITNKKHMAKYGDTKFMQDVQVFMGVRTQVANIYQMLPDGDPRKSILKERYLTMIDKNRAQWDPALSSMIEFYFLNDNLKVVE